MEKKVKGKDEILPPSSEMTRETPPVPLLKSQTKESSYWFAHGRHDDVPGEAQDSKAGGDTKEKQKEADEKLRRLRNLELQEEERLRKLHELELQFVQAKRHREQQEEERRRRIEEAKVKEAERRLQVEERKRQIWEAEQERKEAILRRNMDREARIEARRNAQRFSQCFAFGSSTPRSFDLDLAAIGVRNQGSVLMCSVGSRRSEERETGPPRATSACSLDRKFGEDLMSRSMNSLSTSAFRGRRRTDILPTVTPRDRSATPSSATPRGNHSLRAVSMTRLDQLAQPRRTYRNNLDITTTPGIRAVSPSMSKSMCNLAGKNPTRRPLRACNNADMSRSMLHLPDQPRSSPPKSGMRPAKSMLHLSVPAPRLTRTARLRAEAASAWNLSRPESGQALAGKDSGSPSRSHSSMSGTSEISAASSSVSAVQMRSRPAPRKPRPFSVAGSIMDSSTLMTQSLYTREHERQPRIHDRNVSAPVSKPQRAKSANREGGEVKSTKTVPALKKPLPPPKTTELMTKAKSHPVPVKDNLRKVSKPIPKSTSDERKPSMKAELNSTANQNGINNDEFSKDFENKQASAPSSAIMSPTTDTEKSPPTSSDKFNDDKPSLPNSKQHKEAELKVTQKEINEQTIPSEPQNDVVTAENEVSETQGKEEIPPSMTNSLVMENGGRESGSFKPRITSEEEARAALAEKRRIAREQAEKEAEIERLRLEEMRRKEEEQRHLEELEQKRMEEEQLRLAELHRQLEEEKLAKAIEEQQRREKEEQEKREEEAQQKAEKEEQEKKAREDSEKQRIELEEKLQKEEEARAERKRRVEQIMARTRGKTTAQSPSTPTSSDKSTPTTPSQVELPTVPPQDTQITTPKSLSNGVKNHNDSFVTNSWPFSSPEVASNPLPDILSSTCHNGRDEQVSSGGFSVVSNGTLSANEDAAHQTNGYSSHEEMSCTTSPEENSDMGSLDEGQSCQQRSSKLLPDAVDFTKLVEVDPPSLNNVVHNENFLINVDDVNSNLFNSPNQFLGLQDSMQQKQDTHVTDLLS